jgi:hypothetical protein
MGIFEQHHAKKWGVLQIFTNVNEFNNGKGYHSPMIQVLVLVLV